MANAGQRPSGQKATLPLPTAVQMREDISETPFAKPDEAEEQLVLLPTPVANDANPGSGGELRAAIVHGEGRRNETGVDTLGRPNEGRPSKLLPTPTSQLEHDSQTHRSGDRDGELLLGGIAKKATEHLFPTPTTQDAANTAGDSQRNPTLLGAARRAEVEWGVYEAAVRRWEQVLEREAPAPTDEKGRLDPPFVEWMLGYPEGWFDLDGVSRTRKLRALGNSVQVQCAEAVGGWLTFLLDSGLLLDEPPHA